MDIKFDIVGNCRYSREDKTGIFVFVKFEHLGPDPVEFNATIDDVEQHGRLIFIMCDTGQFGPVAPYEPPAPPPKLSLKQKLARAGIDDDDLKELKKLLKEP